MSSGFQLSGLQSSRYPHPRDIGGLLRYPYGPARVAKSADKNSAKQSALLWSERVHTRALERCRENPCNYWMAPLPSGSNYVFA